MAAAHLLDPDRHPPLKTIEAAPSAPAVRSVPAGEPRDESLVELCASIALRDLNLIDTLLSDLEQMERHEDDSHRLGQLYRLDHLAARLRRNAENLRVLADHDADSDTGETLSVLDTVRAAMSSIDEYAKVSIGRVASLGVVGFAANDLSRVLTELLDNATRHSPPDADVRVSAHLTEQGSVLVRIEDDGIGLPPERLAELNDRLFRSHRLDDSAVRHMGLTVVRRLAERHGLRVSLDHRMPNGTTATVLLPPSLVTELPEANWSGTRTVPTNGRHHLERLPHRRGPAAGPNAAANSTVPDTPADVATNAAPDTAVPDTPATAVPDTPATAAPDTPATGDPADLPEQRPSPIPRRPSPAVGGTTASGLPRRVSRSIKPEAAGGSSAAGSFDSPASEGQDEFLADLDGFTDGEMAARAQEDATEGGDQK
ncbi:sensor histidine kinase [Pseudonocardia sp. C8]|uniref:sensor histidine kinase n=1 Tax=Pseudonocardia sp. C8 TaxID=2762759 RepID=UPI00351C334C